MRWLCVAWLCLLSTSPSVAKHTTPNQAPRQLKDYSDIARVHATAAHGWLQHIVRLEGVDIREQRARVLGELRSSLDVLQRDWYELSLGRWPTSIDWTGAVLNTHLVATLSSFSRWANDDSTHWTNIIDLYFAQASAYYYGEHAASLREQAYDDMLWVVLSWLESIRMVKTHSENLYGNHSMWQGNQYVPVFARRANSFYSLTTQGWTTDLCNGGMLWSPRLEPYKNTITNSLFIAASVGMHLHFPQSSTSFLVDRRPFARTRHLDAAVEAYSWLSRSNMTNKQGLYVDGFHIGGWKRNSSGSTVCDERNEMVYTYNQGVLLSGLFGLWQATGKASYLYDGHDLVRNTIAATGWLLWDQRASNNTMWHGLGRKGIMEDFCDSTGKCDQNGHAFKSIYFHHLASFCQVEPADDSNALLRWHCKQCRRYVQWVAHNAEAALATRDSRGHIGTWWHHSDDWHTLAEPALPSGAIDYRNAKIVGESSPSSDSHRDPNDRGRGRTVESHAGGVAVLRCVLELLHLDDVHDSRETQ